MMENATLFHEYNLCNDNLTVKTVDGSHSRVAGAGPIPISRELTLNGVLHVPSLDCNLLSVSKYTRNHNCIAKFSLYVCEFLDLGS